jgi:hypothetical protein
MTAQTQTIPAQAIQLKHPPLGQRRIIERLRFMSLDKRHD